MNAAELRAKIRAGQGTSQDVVRVYELERDAEVKTIRCCSACGGLGVLADGERCPVCLGRGIP
jgi:hypothetical protein